MRCSCCDLDEAVLDIGAGAPCRRPVLVDGGVAGVAAVATRPASPSSVAEKNSVWRVAGQSATIRSTAGRKPMSSIRSASSRTSIRIVLEREGAAGEQVLEPAGSRDEDVRARGLSWPA